MRILIVEDERPTAEDIQFLIKEIFSPKEVSIHIETTLGNALLYLEEKTIDLLFLDLNLNAKDGFEILKSVVSKSFHTIVISANINRAIEAFEFGVLDFIPKPYTQERIQLALERFNSPVVSSGNSIKYLSVKKGFEIEVIPIEEIKYLKSDNIYVELHLKNSKIEIYDKTLKDILKLLSPSFLRIHKSFAVESSNIDKILTLGGGSYKAVLKSGDILPISRQQIELVKTHFGIQ